MRQIVPDAALDNPVRICAREFLGIRTGVRVRRPIGIPFKGDGGHGDDQTLGKPLFQFVVFLLAFCQTKAQAIVMNYDADMIRIVQRCRAAIERGVIGIPRWRSYLPDELGKIMPVFVVAGPATFRGNIELVPPLR